MHASLSLMPFKIQLLFLPWTKDMIVRRSIASSSSKHRRIRSTSFELLYQWPVPRYFWLTCLYTEIWHVDCRQESAQLSWRRSRKTTLIDSLGKFIMGTWHFSLISHYSLCRANKTMLMEPRLSFWACLFLTYKAWRIGAIGSNVGNGSGLWRRKIHLQNMRPIVRLIDSRFPDLA